MENCIEVAIPEIFELEKNTFFLVQRLWAYILATLVISSLTLNFWTILCYSRDILLLKLEMSSFGLNIRLSWHVGNAISVVSQFLGFS